MGFQSLLKEYESQSPQVDLIPASIETIRNLSEVREMMKALQAEARTYCYVEFDEEDPMQVNIRSVGFAGEQREWQASFGEESLLRFSDFHGFFSDDAIQKVIHSAKNLQVVLLRQGQKLRGLEWDTMLLSYLTQPNRSNHQFEEIVFAHLQKTPAKVSRR